MSDLRPKDCRFRLQEEGKRYPRSGCEACGRTILSGLGNRCHHDQKRDQRLAELKGSFERMRSALIHTNQMLTELGMAMNELKAQIQELETKP